MSISLIPRPTSISLPPSLDLTCRYDAASAAVATAVEAQGGPRLVRISPQRDALRTLELTWHIPYGEGAWSFPVALVTCDWQCLCPVHGWASASACASACRPACARCQHMRSGTSGPGLFETNVHAYTLAC